MEVNDGKESDSMEKIENQSNPKSDIFITRERLCNKFIII